MGREGNRARAPTASGLFVSPAVTLVVRGRVLLLLALLLAACGGGPRVADEAPAPEAMLPAIRAGGVSDAAEAEAVRILRDARGALAADSVARAAELAERVIEEFAGAPGTSEALWILARSAAAVGDDERAAEAAGRFRALLDPNHPLVVPATLLRADALASLGRWASAVEDYLTVSEAAPDSTRARALDGVRRAVQEVSFLELRELSAQPPGAWPRLGAPVAAEMALALHVRERSDEAEEQAQRALDLGAEGEVAALAREVLSGEVRVERRRSALLGSILPESGSPSERQFAEWIQEGVRARIEQADIDGGLPLQLELRDDSGAVSSMSSLIQELGALRPAGVIGPLGNESLAAAASARSVPVPLVSPTATRLPEGAEAVYSLSAPDPGGAVALARFAASERLESAVILHASSDASAFEADRFAEEYRRLGGTVLRRLQYEPGATFFEDPFREVQELLPAALVLPLPAGDIELLAPQITFFGLDTLGVRVLGTASWTDPEVLEEVDSRHTDGVVVATHRAPGGPTPAWLRFVSDYETVLRQTLRSRVPALGYDAAGLLLQAVATGARGPAAVAAALEEIEGFPGATGQLSIRDGRVTRAYHLIRLREREMIPIRLADD